MLREAKRLLFCEKQVLAAASDVMEGTGGMLHIGFVGTTGLSTGPHLHYELIVNGNKVDALKIRLPGGKSLEGKALAQIEIERKRIDDLLGRGDGSTQVAETH